MSENIIGPSGEEGFLDPTIPAALGAQSGSMVASLRAKVVLGVTVPVLMLLFLLVLVGSLHERDLVQSQIELTAAELSQTLKGSLRHAMQGNDQDGMASMLADVGRMETVDRVQILDFTRQVKVASHPEDLGLRRNREYAGCRDCHESMAADRPESVTLSRPADGLRIATVIRNEPECAVCHAETTSALGVLLVDVSLNKYSAHLRDHLTKDLLLVTGFALAVAALVYLLIHWLVVRPVEAFRRPLAEYVAGSYAPRLPVPMHSMDELGQLALAFNHMAGELDRHSQEQSQRFELRQRVVAEERSRIARDLHDGLAQLLGYVNTKAMAIRLLLKQSRIEAAETQLLQLEEAARELSADVRATIHDLKCTAESNASLVHALEELVDSFNRLSDFDVRLAVAPEARDLLLAVEVQEQLVRIVQESLSNVRKHAAASRAVVSVQVVEGSLDLAVSDDGRGFAGTPQSDRLAHFGLQIMRERALAINARFDLESSPGSGTRTLLRLPLESEGTHARTDR